MIRIRMKTTGEICIVSVPFGSYLVWTGFAEFSDANIRYVKVQKA